MIFLRQILIPILLLRFGLIIHAENSIDKIVALANDVPVSQQAVEEQLSFVKRDRAQLGSPGRFEAIKSAIIEALMIQIAEKNGITEYSDVIQQIAAQMIREGNLPLELANNTKKLKRQIICDLIQQQMLAGINFSATKEEINQEIHNLPKKIPQTEVVNFHIETLFIPISVQSSILNGWQRILHAFKRYSSSKEQRPTLAESVEIARKAAEEALIKSQTGISFVELAKATEQKQHWKVESLENTADKLPKIYAHVLPKLRPCEVAGPFQSSQGFYLVRLRKAYGPSTARVRHILLTVPKGTDPAAIKQRLADIRQHCLENNDFAEQAEKYSEDPYTLFKGGDLGWIFQDLVDPVFKAQIALLEPGQISLPFETNAGWHIIQLDQKQWLTNNHPEMNQYIANKLIEKKKVIEALENIQEELYKTAYIKWIDENLQREMKVDE